MLFNSFHNVLYFKTTVIDIMAKLHILTLGWPLLYYASIILWAQIKSCALQHYFLRNFISVDLRETPLVHFQYIIPAAPTVLSAWIVPGDMYSPLRFALAQL